MGIDGIRQATKAYNESLKMYYEDRLKDPANGNLSKPNIETMMKRDMAIGKLALRLLGKNFPNNVNGYNTLASSGELSTIYTDTDLAKDEIHVIADSLNYVYKQAVFGTRFNFAIEGIKFAPYAISLAMEDTKRLVVATPYVEIPDLSAVWNSHVIDPYEYRVSIDTNLSIKTIFMHALAKAILVGEVKLYEAQEGYRPRIRGYEIDYNKLGKKALSVAEKSFHTTFTRRDYTYLEGFIHGIPPLVAESMRSAGKVSEIHTRCVIAV